MKQRFLLLLMLALGAMASPAQSTALRNLDDRLAAAYQTFVQAGLELRNDSLGPGFLALMKGALTDPVTFDHSLDSLSRQIAILTSADKRLKFYSWDAMEGGSWHTIHCLAQYRKADGSIQVQPLNTGDETAVGGYTDSDVHEVHDIVQGEGTSYLTFGWGSHGGGMEHVILRMFDLQGDTLLPCKTCFDTEEGQVIEYPRSCRLQLNYDAVKQQVSYAVFQSPNAAGFSRPVTALTVLQLGNVNTHK